MLCGESCGEMDHIREMVLHVLHGKSFCKTIVQTAISGARYGNSLVHRGVKNDLMDVQNTTAVQGWESSDKR